MEKSGDEVESALCIDIDGETIFRRVESRLSLLVASISIPKGDEGLEFIIREGLKKSSDKIQLCFEQVNTQFWDVLQTLNFRFISFFLHILLTREQIF